MAFWERVTWTGTTLTLGDLRELVERTDTLRTDTPVSVTVEPTYPSPTDPGGGITISVGR